MSREAFAIALASLAARAQQRRDAQARSLVNTSLSGTLFFLSCWCIRDVVHLDPRVHAAIKAISHIGGQHGQESEEGEEGEERSEEDCEEDPQGREEEEVTSLLKLPATRWPARHQRPLI
jgi:hypothetical protein